MADLGRFSSSPSRIRHKSAWKRFLTPRKDILSGVLAFLDTLSRNSIIGIKSLANQSINQPKQASYSKFLVNFEFFSVSCDEFNELIGNFHQIF
jgi:hypothetical protein